MENKNLYSKVENCKIQPFVGDEEVSIYAGSCTKTSLYGNYLHQQHFTISVAFVHEYDNGFVSDSLHQLLKPVLILARCLALLPVDGVTEKSVNSVRFRWKSLHVMYAFIVFIGSGVLLIFTVVKTISTGLTFLGTVEFVFYGTGTIIIVMFLNLAVDWSSILYEWGNSEKYVIYTLGSIHKLPTLIKWLVLTVCVLIFTEYVLAVISVVASVVTCSANPYSINLIEVVNKIRFKQIFSVTSYTHWKAAPVMVINFMITFIRNFMDLFLMVMSVILSSRFQQVNQRLHSVKGKNVPTRFWRQMRESYNRLSCLIKLIDNKLSPIVLLSFANNLYFICVQLLTSLKPFQNIVHSIYFVYAFGFLVVRTCSVSLLASAVYDESKKPMAVLFSVPSESYCTEVDRFLKQVTSDELALTGCRFFHVTRTLMLTIAGTIATYEIVLVQFNAVNTPEEAHNFTSICPIT